MPRLALPHRRPNETITIETARGPLIFTVGYDPSDLRPREVFISSGKDGSEARMLLEDAAVAISVALQSGVSARSMAKSIGKIPLDLEGAERCPASAIGYVLEALAELER